MKTADVQQIIFNESGLKTSAKQGTGSMKGYVIITPLFQNGEYPNIPYEALTLLRGQFPGEYPKENFFTRGSVAIYKSDGNPVIYKKERKPKHLNTDGNNGWGSKNSQLRLDKAASRYAKRVRRGDNTVRYY